MFTKSDDPGELAREHKRLGYSAAYCPKATVEDGDRVRAIMKAFAAENVVISEVGAWVNMLDPDLEKRRKNMEYVTSPACLGRGRRRVVLCRYRGVLSSDGLVWTASEESIERVLRRDGGELP